MKRFYATIIITLIICSLCILNIPKYTLTTTLSTNSSSNIEKPIELEELDKKEYNSIKKSKSGSKGLKTSKYMITHYGYDCKGCSGITASEYNVKNTIYYNDSTYGKVRIIAFNKLPLYSIVKIKDYKGSEIIAIVLDRGTNHIDLLVNNEKEASKLGITRSDIEILRSGK